MKEVLITCVIINLLCPVILPRNKQGLLLPSSSGAGRTMVLWLSRASACSSHFPRSWGRRKEKPQLNPLGWARGRLSQDALGVRKFTWQEKPQFPLLFFILSNVLNDIVDSSSLMEKKVTEFCSPPSHFCTDARIGVHRPSMQQWPPQCRSQHRLFRSPPARHGVPDSMACGTLQHISAFCKNVFYQLCSQTLALGHSRA